MPEVNTRLAQALADFERSWDETRLAARVRELPPPGDPLRRPLLVGLVRIDLAQQWARGRRAVLEAYLKLYPELGTPDTVPLGLVRTEYELRQKHGAPGGLDLFARRFPRRADELRRLLGSPADASRDTPGGLGATGPFVPPPPPGDLPDRFGRYRILKKLGRGGMGTVYLAHDGQLDRQVALKVPRLDRSGSPEFIERFYREARAAATLHHPNICPVYDVGEINGVHFVTMAYVEGRTLAELIREKDLPQRAAAAVVRKLALAMQQAHEKGVVHRDLKPANVMSARNGEPVVMDFGLALRADRDDARLTGEGAAMGTPAYMPPEQVKGDLAAMGPACDIYSLGVILYEMLTGRVPFAGKSGQVLALILTQPPDPPSRHRADLNPALGAVCLKAMAKKPADRYASMADFAAALAHYLQGSKGAAPAAEPKAVAVPVKADEATAGAGDSGARGTGTRMIERLVARLEKTVAESRARRARRWPWVAAGAVLLAIILALAAVLLLRGGKGAENPPVLVRLAGVANYYADNSVNFFLDGNAVSRDELRDKVALRPGDHELVVKRGDAVVEVRPFKVGREDNEKQVVVPPPPESVAGGVGEARRFPGAGGRVLAVAFLDDGNVASVADGAYCVWSEGRDKEVKRIGLNDVGWSGAVLPDGSRFLYGTGREMHSRDVVYYWDTNGKQPLRTLAGWEAYASCVAFSPDGRSVLCASNPFLPGAPASDNVVRLWDAASGEEVARFQGHAACFAPGGGRLLTAKDNDLLLWDVRPPRKEQFRLTGHTAPPLCLAFTPDGERVVSGGTDKTVRAWGLAARRELHTLKGHTKPVRAVAVSPDGRRALSAGEDGALWLWALEAGTEVTHFDKAHDGAAVWCVAFSRGGRRALSGGTDATVRLWNLPE